MNPIVKHILIYTIGIITGVSITLGIVMVVHEPAKDLETKSSSSSSNVVIKTDTIERVVYKKKEKLLSKTEGLDLEPERLINDSTKINEDSIQNEKINQEILLATKEFSVLVLDEEEVNALRDSLEASMGINKEKNNQLLQVEFWESPLNFEGYILGKNLVRLYGVSELEDLSFYRLENRIYLKKESGVYVLTRSEEYHKFELSKEGVDDRILQISRNG